MDDTDKADQWFRDVTLVTAVSANPWLGMNLSGDEEVAFNEAAHRLAIHAGFDLEEVARREPQSPLILPED